MIYIPVFITSTGIIYSFNKSIKHSRKFYWEHVTEFKNEQKEMSARTLEGKVTLLKKKAQYHKQYSESA
jgi:hypothetical protein